jgi:hypothetical protein
VRLPRATRRAAGRWGRKQDAGSVVRIPASEIENRVARAVGAHLAGQTNTIDGCRADHGILGGIQAVTQHGQTRCLRQDPPTEKDVRNAIERATVSATRIEIVLNESVVAEGQDRVLTLPWTRTSSRRRREIIQAVGEAQQPLRAMRTKAREGFSKAFRELGSGGRTHLIDATAIHSLQIVPPRSIWRP